MCRVATYRTLAAISAWKNGDNLFLVESAVGGDPDVEHRFGVTLAASGDSILKRILFVDDEPRILDGLQRLLRPQRKQWEMVFALGGAAALRELSTGTFDVIVTDMRMPQIDGATLLRQVQRDYPQMVRIVLTGHADFSAVLSVVGVAHQFLAKPCQPEVLKDAVDRASELQEILNSERLRRLVGRLGSLPSRPNEYFSVLQILDNPDAGAAEIARVLRRDMGMSAKCLQLVNSAFFGLPQRVVSVERAVAYLGVSMLKSLVLSAEAFSLFHVDPRLADLCYRVVPDHSLSLASLAGRLVEDRGLVEDAFLAGALADVGTLVLASGIPDEYVRILGQARETERSVVDVERDELGCSHAEVGAYLLGVWGLPYGIVEAVARHHAPREAATGAPRVDLPLSVYLAEALLWERTSARDTGRAIGKTSPLAERFADDRRLAGWRDLAGQLVDSMEASPVG